MIAKRATTEERFWDKISKMDNGCWEWVSTKNHLGYGQFWDGKRLALAHRFSLQLHNITIPRGLECDHLCRNRSCVNPAHIELVTHQVNISRGVNVGKANLKKTHCVNGHPYSVDNTYITIQGWRMCKICRTEKMRGYLKAKVSRG